MKSLNQRQLQLHVPVVGWLLIALNAIVLLLAGFIFVLMTGVGVAVSEPEARVILPVVGTIVPLMMGMLTLPDFIAAFGLLTRKRWGRILGIVVGALNLPGFPMGTLVGGYAIWVLMQDAATEYFTPQASV